MALVYVIQFVISFETYCIIDRHVELCFVVLEFIASTHVVKLQVRVQLFKTVTCFCIMFNLYLLAFTKIVFFFKTRFCF